MLLLLSRRTRRFRIWPILEINSTNEFAAPLAALLAQKADVWLLDEPATGLDVGGRAMLLEVLSEAKAQGRCLVLVTHDPTAFEGVTDAQYRLERGRLNPVEPG